MPYRGRDFVVDYPPLAMALWRWSWRAVTALAPDLDHGEAENAAVKLPAVLGDVAGVALLLALFRATPRRALGLAALYWALPVSWLSSGVLGFLDGALAVLVVAACVAAGRGRAAAAGIALALAALIKPTALIVAPAVWCALAARRASPARAIAAGAVVVAASLVPFALAGTLQTAIVHVYRILFQGTLSGGFPNPWWLLGHVVTVVRDGAPALGPVRFARLDRSAFPARPIGTLLFAAAAVLVWRAQRGREGATPAVTAGALLVLAYGVCAVGVHENHPHPLFLLLCATGLATARLRAARGRLRARVRREHAGAVGDRAVLRSALRRAGAARARGRVVPDGARLRRHPGARRGPGRAVRLGARAAPDEAPSTGLTVAGARDLLAPTLHPRARPRAVDRGARHPARPESGRQRRAPVRVPAAPDDAAPGPRRPSGLSARPP